MAWYVVSYDLRKEPDVAGYQRLYDVMQAFPDWAWPLASVWIVQADSAKAVLDRISAVLDDNDGLVVAELTGELCSRRVRTGTADWLKERFKCR